MCLGYVLRWLLTSIRTLLLVAIISSVVLLLVFSGQPQQGVLSVKALGLTHEGVPTSQLGEGLSRSIRLMAWGSLRVPAIDLGKVKEVVVNVGGSVIGEGPDYVDVSLPVIIYREEGGWPRANVFIRVFRNGSVIAWLSKGELWE